MAIKYNIVFDVVISVDQNGILEYWHGPTLDYKFPSKVVSFESKLDTSLFEFAKNKTIVTGIAFSRDGLKFATLSTDRKVGNSFITTENYSLPQSPSLGSNIPVPQREDDQND